jgi:hypothetical protein
LANGSACSNVPPGGVCRSNCTFSGTGTPYTATCIAGNWNVTGNCTRKLTILAAVGWHRIVKAAHQRHVFDSLCMSVGEGSCCLLLYSV